MPAIFPGGHAASQDGLEDLVGGGVDGGVGEKGGRPRYQRGPALIQKKNMSASVCL